MIYIGAEIFIEPGQTEKEIYSWFESMQKYGLGLTRIRMFENYMRTGEVWDFSLFDLAFKAAERFEIKIYANLFPETDFSDVGGFKFPRTEEHLISIANYIEHVVLHFNQFSSLYGWVPINEPGSGALPDDDFTIQQLEIWKRNKSAESYNSKGFNLLDLSRKQFLLNYNTWFLRWLSEEIRKYDKFRPIHVNNHDIFNNVAEYDFPSWREFLTSLGGSAHASWHFDYFHRNQFAFAMSANAEILRSGAGPIPWYMTELQGGNNTYSGRKPICPTKEEIAQWLWINIGSGSEGGMFWCLNPRKSGFEAGEWAMLDFNNEATDRLLMASDVSDAVKENSNFFSSYEVYDSGVSVLYTRESLWVESELQISNEPLEGRQIGGVMKSAISYFEALSEMGIHASFNEIREFNFNKENYKGQAIILSHQISIPSKFWTLLKGFVAKGGKLIVDGLTAYYDENAYCIHGADFPFEECFGANIRGFKTIDTLFQITLKEFNQVLNAHLWRGSLKMTTAIAIAIENPSNNNGQIYGCRNNFKDGAVVWIPSLLGLGSRISGSYAGLCEFLRQELSDIIPQLPIIFQTHQPGMLLKILRNDSSCLLVLINKSGKNQSLLLKTKDLSYKKTVFSSDKSRSSFSDQIEIKDEETLVVEWIGNA